MVLALMNDYVITTELWAPTRESPPKPKKPPMGYSTDSQASIVDWQLVDTQVLDNTKSGDISDDSYRFIWTWNAVTDDE